MTFRRALFLFGLFASIFVTAVATGPLFFQDATNFSGWKTAQDVRPDYERSACRTQLLLLTECSYYYTFPHDTSGKNHILTYLLINSWQNRDFYFLRAVDDQNKITVNLGVERLLERSFTLFGWLLVVVADFGWRWGYVLLDRWFARATDKALHKKVKAERIIAPVQPTIGQPLANQQSASPQAHSAPSPYMHSPRGGFGRRKRA